MQETFKKQETIEVSGVGFFTHKIIIMLCMVVSY